MHGSRTFFEKCPYQEMLRTGRRESFELPLGDSWYQVTADPLFDEAGEIVGAVHVVRDITDRRRTENALAERSRWLVAISDLAVDLAALEGEADLGRFLAARLRELTGAVAVAFSEYDPIGRMLATRAIEFQPGAVKTLTAPLARRLRGTRSPVSETAYREILASSNATRATLTEASFGAIPPAVDVTVRKLLGVDRFVGIAYVIEGALYGTSVIALKADTPAPPREELETFANLGAVSLRRRRAEVELSRQTEQVDALFALSEDILGIGDHERGPAPRQPRLGGDARLLGGGAGGPAHRRPGPPGRPGEDACGSGAAGGRPDDHRLRQSAAASGRVLPAHRVARHPLRGTAHRGHRPRHHRQGRGAVARGGDAPTRPPRRCAAPAPTTAA